MNITPRTLTANFAGVSRVYDGTTAATVLAKLPNPNPDLPREVRMGLRFMIDRTLEQHHPDVIILGNSLSNTDIRPVLLARRLGITPPAGTASGAKPAAAAKKP